MKRPALDVCIKVPHSKLIFDTHGDQRGERSVFCLERDNDAGYSFVFFFKYLVGPVPSLCEGRIRSLGCPERT